MSLLIHGTKLPRSNTMTNAVIRVRQDGTAEIIIHYEHKSESFKLTEIPTPHGRLIDADKLTKNMRNYYPSIDYLCCSQHVVTKGDIDNAPTVIEAEHESEARKWARVGRDISKGLQEGIEAINSEEIEE